MKNREYRTASGRRSTVSSNEHTVWFGEEVEMEKGGKEGGREVAEKKDDTEAGRDEVDIRKEELDDAEAEIVKGKEEAEEKVVIVSEE